MADANTGIFGDERVMQFFIHLKEIVGNCFSTLHKLSIEKSHSIQNDDDTQSRFKRALHKSFNVGLTYMSVWDESIHAQEAASALKRSPTLEQDYKYTLVRYVKHLHRKQQARMRLKVPPFKSFLYWLLCRISKTEEMKSMVYFDEFKFNDKDVFLREMLRQTLSKDCLPVAMIAESSVSRHSLEAGGVEASSTPSVPTASTPAPPPATSVISRAMTQVTIQPRDSISNVIPPSHVAPQYSSTLRLTPEVLKQHLQHIEKEVACSTKHIPVTSLPPPMVTSTEQEPHASIASSSPFPVAPPASVPGSVPGFVPGEVTVPACGSKSVVSDLMTESVPGSVAAPGFRPPVPCGGVRKDATMSMPGHRHGTAHMEMHRPPRDQRSHVV